jgi:uncharacterized damage-inducible protein DinB
MSGELATYTQLFQQTLQRWQALLAPLTEAQLDARPLPEGNSLRVLAAHTLGASRFLAVDIAQGSANPQRDRQAEFSATAQTHSKAALLDGLAALAEAIPQLDPNRLDAQQAAPDGRVLEVRWALWHALLHASQHLGQAQILVRLITAPK